MQQIPIKEEEYDKPAGKLLVGGLTKFTTIDFPGCLSAVIFVRGCPWKCVYCQNRDLQTREVPGEERPVSWQEIDAFLEKRKGLIDGVVFSGGEPLIDTALFNAVKAVREKGYKVGLHTGGAYSKRLERLLPMLDWVGIDVKAPLEDRQAYEKVAGRRNAAPEARASLEMILASGVPYEVRTTAHPDYLTDADLLRIGEELGARNVRNFALQIYRQPPQAKPGETLERVGSDYPAPETTEALKARFENFILRR